MSIEGPGSAVSAGGSRKSVADRELLELDPVRLRVEEPHTPAEEIRDKVGL
jgi:hypothetical protein